MPPTAEGAGISGEGIPCEAGLAGERMGLTTGEGAGGVLTSRGRLTLVIRLVTRLTPGMMPPWKPLDSAIRY